MIPVAINPSSKAPFSLSTIFIFIIKHRDKITQLEKSFSTERGYGLKEEGNTHMFESDESDDIF